MSTPRSYRLTDQALEAIKILRKEARESGKGKGDAEIVSQAIVQTAEKTNITKGVSFGFRNPGELLLMRAVVAEQHAHYDELRKLALSIKPKDANQANMLSAFCVKLDERLENMDRLDRQISKTSRILTQEIISDDFKHCLGYLRKVEKSHAETASKLTTSEDEQAKSIRRQLSSFESVIRVLKAALLIRPSDTIT